MMQLGEQFEWNQRSYGGLYEFYAGRMMNWENSLSGIKEVMEDCLACNLQLISNSWDEFYYSNVHWIFGYLELATISMFITLISNFLF
jgi:hypothetical protein